MLLILVLREEEENLCHSYISNDTLRWGGSHTEVALNTSPTRVPSY